MKTKKFIYNSLPKIGKMYFDLIERSPIGYRLAKGTFWSLLGNFVARSLQILSFIIVARIIGKLEFGKLGIIQSTIGMFLVFASFGSGLTATKNIAESKNHDSLRTGRIIAFSIILALGTGLLMALLLVALAPWLSSKTLNEPSVSPLLRVSSVALLFGGMNIAQFGIFSGFEAFKITARINFLSGILAFLFIVIGSYFWGLPGAIVGLGASAATTFAIGHNYLTDLIKTRGLEINWAESKKELKTLIHCSLPTMLINALTVPVFWICNAILVNSKNGLEEMGLFNAANQWRLAILFLPGILGNIILPILTELKSQKDHRTTKQLVKYQIVALSILSIIPCLIISLTSKKILNLYGPDFLTAVPCLNYCVFSTIPLTLINLISTHLYSLGFVWRDFFANILWALFFIGITFMTTNSQGATGLALSIFLSYWAKLIFMVFIFPYEKLGILKIPFTIPSTKRG